eukprot:466466-Pyramimonas_sp.AAC.1
MPASSLNAEALGLWSLPTSIGMRLHSGCVLTDQYWNLGNWFAANCSGRDSDASYDMTRRRREAAGDRLSDGGDGYPFGESLLPVPCRIPVHLGPLEVHSLVDCGSALDAVDKDLSRLQSQSGNH